MSEPIAAWSDRIAVEDIGGVPYRMYADRPRRVTQLLAFAEGWGEKPHIIQGDRIVTFAGLRRGSADKARILRELGIGPGDRVVIFGWNSADWVMNFWACVQIDAIPVLANAWWGESEIAHALDLLKPRMVLADANTERKIPAQWPRGPWGADENAADGAMPSAPDPDAVLPGENDVALIIFTSGTDGNAKAVMLSHRALLSGLQMMLHITRQLPPRLDGTKSEICLHTGPLFHVGGPQVMLRSVAVGNTLVFLAGRFDPADVLALIERHHIGRWTAVPTMINRALEHPDLKTRDLSSLKAIGMGGAPVAPTLLSRLRTDLPDAQLRVAIGYGLTENTGPATTASGEDSARYPGTSGRPLPCVEIRIDEPKPGVEDGEVLIRSPSLMSGYFGLAQSPIDPQGWLHTGDLGKVDATGRLWITGRSKDLIIRGGENIAPASVEKALAALPEVAEVAVVGVPHPDLGEEVMAFVVVRQPTTAEHLRDQVRGSLASFAVPSRWHLQSEPLPTNQTGKVDKNAVKARARELPG